MRQWFTTAPVYIVACGDTHASWKRQSDGKDHCDVDIAIAVEHICLAATEQGLGTCWVCNFDVEKCKQALNLSAGMQPIAIIPVGYPAADTQDTVRKPLKDITRTI